MTAPQKQRPVRSKSTSWDEQVAPEPEATAGRPAARRSRLFWQRPVVLTMALAVLVAVAFAVPLGLDSASHHTTSPSSATLPATATTLPSPSTTAPTTSVPGGTGLTPVRVASILAKSLVSATSAGSFQLRVSGGTDNGEVIVLTKKGGELVTSPRFGSGAMLAAGKTVYIKGSRLLTTFGAPAFAILTDARRWFSLPLTSTGAVAVASLLSSSAEISLLRLTNAFELSATRSNVTLFGDLPKNLVSGAADADATVTISSQAPYYPLSLKISAGSRDVTFTYSRWRKVSPIKFPSGSVPLRALSEASGTRAEQQILQAISVRNSDLRPGHVALLLAGGNQVLGQVTLNLCSSSYASERLRVARRQVGVAGGNFSTEAVIYSSSAATATAFAEIRAAVAACPRGFVRSQGFKVSFGPRPDRFWPSKHGVARLAYSVTATGRTGRPQQEYWVYLRRGRVLLAIHMNNPTPELPFAVAGKRSLGGIVKVFEDRLAALSAFAVR